MHPSTFDYLKPTDDQLKTMEVLRGHTKDYAEKLEQYLPPGADRDYIMRKLRELAMWNNVAITRFKDGTPR